MAVDVYIAERIRIARAQLGEPLADRLREAFTYENPLYAHLASQDYDTKGEPPILRTWAHDGADLTLPRGGMDRVRRLLAGDGVARTVHDARCEGDADMRRLMAAYPPHRVELWTFQARALEEALRRENAIIRAPTGCVSGNAVVGVHRNGKGWQLPLSEVVRRFNGGVAGNRRWDLSQPTFVRCPCAEGTIRKARLLSAKGSGKKPTFRLVTRGGFSIEATAEHRLQTPFGWVELLRLGVGDFVLVNGGPRAAKRQQKPWYKLCVARNHPFAGRRGVNPAKGGWTVPVHRLVAEARHNGLTLEEFLAVLEEGRTGLLFLDPAVWVVHHKNEDPLDNDPSNLVVLTHAQHRAEHAVKNTANVLDKLVPDEVVSIRYAGEQETYDLEVEADVHAFIADGIAVHNSGKTTVGTAFIRRAGLPALVLVWMGGLVDQWVERIEREIGVDPGVVGDGKFEVAPITVAMVQTVMAMGQGERKRFLGLFGTVVGDELQRFAAPTVFEAADPVPARYRLGLTADETRHDRKELLIYDLFGDDPIVIEQEEVLAAGKVLEVEVRVVPTEFRADWYAPAMMRGDDFQRRKAFHRLHKELSEDAGRNALIRELVKQEVEGGAGEQVLVLIDRREHCVALDQQFTGAGLRTGRMLGSKADRAEFQRTKERLRTGNLDVAVGTVKAVGAGIDLPSVARGVVATHLANNRQQLGQVKGRICRASERTGKSDAVLYYLWDRHVYGRKALENLVRWNKRVQVRRGDGGWEGGKEFLSGMRGDAPSLSEVRARRRAQEASDHG